MASARLVGTKLDFCNSEKKATRKTAHMQTCRGERKSNNLKIANKMATVMGNLRAGGLASMRLAACFRKVTSEAAMKVTSAPKYRLTCLRQLR